MRDFGSSRNSSAPTPIAEALLEGLTENCIPLIERFGYPKDGNEIDTNFMNLDINLR